MRSSYRQPHLSLRDHPADNGRMDTKRTWHKKKSAWARARAAEYRQAATAVPGLGAISPKSYRSASASAGKLREAEHYWLDVAERLEARGE